MAKGKYREWLEPDNLLRLEAWARDGLTDEQIAKNMGITTTTLYEWKKLYSVISESLKRGKEVIDIEVENALLKRAIGFKIKKQTPMKLTEKFYNEETGKVTGSKEVIEIVETEEEIIPDTTAQIFWLKNRKTKEWRDKQEVETTNININSQEKTDAELLTFAKKLGVNLNDIDNETT